LRTGIFSSIFITNHNSKWSHVFLKSGLEDQIKKCYRYCVIKCVKTKLLLKGKFASCVLHSCNAKTQKTQICVTGPQCVKILCSVNILASGCSILYLLVLYIWWHCVFMLIYSISCFPLWLNLPDDGCVNLKHVVECKL
jgi:hypothetical protein